MEAVEMDTEALATVCRANDIDYLALFGSVARGEATPESDPHLREQILRETRVLYEEGA